MKHLFKSLTPIICCLVLTSGPIFAEERPEINEEREVVGSYELSEAEETLVLEEKIKEEAVKLAQETEESTDREISAYSYETYTVVHQGAFHYSSAITSLGDLVELEDGSVWVVADNDRFDTLNWSVSDPILIIPNHNWFSAYDYRLVNVNTGASVRVNLSQAPYYNGINTRYITGIDYNEGLVYLNDGSCWRITYFDRAAILSKWKYNDTIIIGTNDDWLASSCPHSLINVTVLNYARSQCLN